MMTVILDTSFLLAVTYRRDRNHLKARAVLSTMPIVQILPTPVLFETFYMLTARTHYQQAVTFFESVLNGNFAIIEPTAQDMQRMLEIQKQYRDAEFDFADTAIMALAERLNISQSYSFDQRDFQIFRPHQGAFLEVLPV